MFYRSDINPAVTSIHWSQFHPLNTHKIRIGLQTLEPRFSIGSLRKSAHHGGSTSGLRRQASLFLCKINGLYCIHKHSSTCSNNPHHAKEERLTIAALPINPAIYLQWLMSILALILPLESAENNCFSF